MLLRRLTSLRWFAALAVFAHHVDASFRLRWDWLAPGAAVGVGFFFVLSGFVLAWSSRPDDTARRMWRRRFARIYPATAVSVLAAIGVWLFGVSAVSVTPGGVVSSLTLTQAWFPTGHPLHDCNGVTWSLACEAFFYALLPWLLKAARARTTPTVLTLAGAGLLLAIAVTFAATVAHHAAYTYYCPLVRLPEFAAGIALAVAIQRGWRPRIPVSVGAAAAAGCWAIAAALHSQPAQVQVYASLPGAVVLILAAAGRDLDGAKGLLTTRFMVYLGEVSFCFYLTHWLAVSITTDASLAFVLAFASAAALHHWVELPAKDRITGWRSTRSGQLGDVNRRTGDRVTATVVDLGANDRTHVTRVDVERRRSNRFDRWADHGWNGQRRIGGGAWDIERQPGRR